jgi:hypothetical protein
MVKRTKEGPNFAQFTLLSIGVALIFKTPRTLGVNFSEMFPFHATWISKTLGVTSIIGVPTNR